MLDKERIVAAHEVVDAMINTVDFGPHEQTYRNILDTLNYIMGQKDTRLGHFLAHSCGYLLEPKEEDKINCQCSRCQARRKMHACLKRNRHLMPDLESVAHTEERVRAENEERMAKQESPIPDLEPENVLVARIKPGENGQPDPEDLARLIEEAKQKGYVVAGMVRFGTDGSPNQQQKDAESVASGVVPDLFGKIRKGNA